MQALRCRKGGERRVLYLISPLTRHGNHKTSLETKIGDSSASTRDKVFFHFFIEKVPTFFQGKDGDKGSYLFIAIRSPDAVSSSASSVPSIPALYGAILGRPWKMLSVTAQGKCVISSLTIMLGLPPTSGSNCKWNVRYNRVTSHPILVCIYFTTNSDYYIFYFRRSLTFW